MHLPVPDPSTGNCDLHLLGSEGILFCRETRRLFYLNTAAAFVWCCLEDGLDPAAAAEALSQQFGIPRPDAARDVEASLTDWRKNGLLGNPPFGFTHDDNQEASDSPWTEDRSSAADTEVLQQPDELRIQPERASSDEEPVEAPPAPSTISAVGELEHHYRLGSVRLCVGFPSPELSALVHPVLAHLEEAPSSLAGGPSFSLEIAGTEAGYIVYRNGDRLGDGLAGNALAPFLVREALLTAYELSDCLVAIHAAAVSNGTACLLLPASPGSGKSTLAAALMSDGLTCLADELVLLTPKPHCIRPVPVSLGLKVGSWPLLRERFPELETLPVHRQGDGTEVRYLPPSKDGLSGQRRLDVRAIVFPQHGINQPYELRKMGPAEALYCLAKAGYAVPGRLDASVVAQLINWLSPIDCYGLGVHDLPTATSQLKELLT